MHSKLSNAELMQILQERYESTVVPPCRICGAPLRVTAIGGGRPTKYACSTQRLGDGYPTIDWEHYECSKWSDYRQGGDSAVVELLCRFRAALAGAEDWIPAATPPELRPADASPYGWPASVPVLARYRNTDKKAVVTFEHVDENEEPRWFTSCSERWNVTQHVECWRRLPD